MSSKPINLMLITATTAALALAAVGCGGGGDDQSQIRSTFDKAANSLADGNGEEFCSALTPEAQSQFSQQIANATGTANCAKGVSNLLKAAKSLTTNDWKTFCESIGDKQAASIAASGPALKTAKDCVAAAGAISQTTQGRQAFASLKTQLDQALGRLRSGKLDTITVKGDTATATVANAKATDRPVSFKKVDGSWKITQAAPAR